MAAPVTATAAAVPRIRNRVFIPEPPCYKETLRERYDLFQGLFGRLHRHGGQHRALAPVDVVELVAHLGGHPHPSALLQRLVAVVAAGEAHELDVLHAAGHGKAAGHKAVLAGAVGLADLCQEFAPSCRCTSGARPDSPCTRCRNRHPGCR